MGLRGSGEVLKDFGMTFVSLYIPAGGGWRRGRREKMRNRRIRKACKCEAYTKASWYNGQHYYRLGKRGMKSRVAIDYSSR